MADLLSFSSIFLFFGIWIAYKVVLDWWTERQFQAFARANNCAPPKQLPNKVPWGLDRMFGLFKMAREGGDILDDLIMKGHQAFGGTYEGEGVFGIKVLSTSEPANLQAVHATKAEDFSVGSYRQGSMAPLLGKGIFTSEGPDWERGRALLRPVFNRESLNDLESTEKAVKQLLDVLPGGDEEGWTEEAEVLPLLYRTTLDVATEFLFGQSVESQVALKGVTEDYSDPKTLKVTDDKEKLATMAGPEFARSFDDSMDWMATRIRLQGLYYLADALNFRRVTGNVRRWTRSFIRVALKDEEKAVKKYNLLDALLKETRDETELTDQVLSLLTAGRDSTANLITWTLIMLAHNPHVFTKLRNDILSTFPSTSSIQNISIKELKGCSYLRYVINETLRLYPVLPLNARIAVRNTVLPTGGGPNGDQPVAVRKGQRIFFAAYVLHRRKDLWGDDADVFRPERWEGRRLDWSFMPFGGGPRICLGQQYALSEASYVILRLLQQFDDIQTTNVAAKPKKRLTLVLSPLDARFRFHKAKDIE